MYCGWCVGVLVCMGVRVLCIVGGVHSMCGIICVVWRVFIVGGVGVYLRVLVSMGVRVLCIVGGGWRMCGVWRVFIVGGVGVFIRQHLYGQLGTISVCLSGVFNLCVRECVQVVLVCASGVFVCAYV